MKNISNCFHLYVNRFYQQMMQLGCKTTNNNYCCSIYKQLYPSKDISDFIGSGNERTSAVIIAYWCNTGNSPANIVNINFHKPLDQVFYCPQHDWFGKSAMVSSVLNETNDACCFMPILIGVLVVQFQWTFILIMKLFCCIPYLYKLLHFNVYLK